MPTTRSYVAKPAQALPARKWWIVDARGQALGRLASRVASVLRGKHRATFTPHVDTGDFVIVVNASEIKLTGNKLESKKYYRHSGHPGGIREYSFAQVSARDPGYPIEKAVRGMLPKSILGKKLLRKLKVYAKADHPHAAQKPQPLAL
jgi:large subunit ribosomal protein L13